jgi:mevalonate kinase
VCEESLPEVRRLGRGRLALSATIERGLGFGSSAALCVALSSCLSAAVHGGPEPGAPSADRVWALAHEAERLFHGTPSGIDTGLSLLDGLYAFSPRPPELPAAARLPGFPLELVVGAVPRSTRAGLLIGGLRERMLAGDAATQRRLESLGELAARAITILEQGDARRSVELGALFWRGGEVLGELGLASPELDQLLTAGRAHGALGGKLSGAGGGGAFFLMYGSRQEAEASAGDLREVARSLGLGTAGSIRARSWAGPSR